MPVAARVLRAVGAAAEVGSVAEELAKGPDIRHAVEDAVPDARAVLGEAEAAAEGGVSL